MNNSQFIAINRFSKGIETEDIPKEFKSIEFKKWKFYFHSNSIVKFGINQNKFEYLVFGVCVNLKDSQDVIELLENCRDENDLLYFKYYLSGRFFIFFNDKFFTDCSGHLQLFYNREIDLVSSSLGLIGSLLRIKPCTERLKELKKLEFYPGPETIYKEINLLLSNQILESGSVQYYKKELIHSRSSKPEKDFIEFTQKFINEIKQSYEILLPLTGGMDSRVILGFLKSQNVAFNSYTTRHSRIRIHDILVPRILSIIFGFNYRLLKMRKQIGYSEIKKQLSKFEQHTGLNCVDLDKRFYIFKGYPVSEKNYKIQRRIMLRGAGFAVFKLKGIYKQLFETKEIDIDAKLNIIWSHLSSKDIFVNANKSLRKWFEGESYFKYNWRYQYYIDQRLNSWDGSIEQALCLAEFEPSLLINSDLQMDLLYDICMIKNKGRKTKSSYVHEAIMYKLNPILNLIPINFSNKNILLKVLYKVMYILNIRK